MSQERTRHQQPRIAWALWPGLLALFVTAVACYAYWSYRRASEQRTAEIDDRLRIGVAAIPGLLPADFHDRAVDADSISAAEHRALMRRLTQFADQAGFFYAYTAIGQDGKVPTTATSATHEERSGGKLPEYFLYWENPIPRFFEALENGKTIFAETNDELGHIRSVYMGCVSPGGRRYVAGVDYEVSYVEGVVQREMLQSLGAALIALLAAAPLVLTFVLTRRRQARELERSEGLFRSVVQDLPAFVCRNRPDGTLIFVNDEYCAYFGLPRKELIGQNFFNLIPSEDRDAVRVRLLALTAEDPVQIHEHPVIAADGGVRFHRWKNRAICDAEGKVIEFVAYGEDITEWKKAEEEKATLEANYAHSQKVESIGRLAGGVAHDLNNLLVPIIGYCELLNARLDGDADSLGYVKEVRDAGFRARDLVQQLLAFGRKQTLEYTAVDLNRTLHGFQKLLRRTIREDIEIELLPASEIRLIDADVGQLEQVIMNLAVNAADAMPDGGRLTIETSMRFFDVEEAARESVGSGDYVSMSVRDEGHGLDPGVRGRLFEPFFSTKGTLGTGLGLATVDGIVSQHGGFILVGDNPEKGTAFDVFLPASRTAVLTPSTSDSVAAGPSGSETILIAEDNDQVRGLAQAMLSRQGYTLLLASDGVGALEILDQQGGRIDLLITDVIMPGMNGRELFDRATQRFPELRVLYMSGYPDDVIAHAGVLDEGVCFISKPFTLPALVSAVRNSLARG